MSKKAWEGRFKEKNDPLFEKMNRSLDFDIRLFKEDILLNKVYSKELKRIGIISEEELELIINGLDKIEKEIEEKGISLFTSDIEDIHMGIEDLLSKRIGDIAKKMHTGKSRNDQVATDVRLYLLKEINNIKAILKDFISCFIDIAENNIVVPMPGYTHLRQAQPVLFSHYLMSFVWPFLRDYQRLSDSVKRVSIMPLGSAALAGSAFPLDRENLRKDLGFLDISQNSMDAVSSRDFILEFLSIISLLCINLSRYAEDFILYSSEHFNFFELSDKVTTGSSIMPNKKNPDSLELTRGKSGRIVGSLMSLLTVTKSLPSTYNKDLQEDKEPLFDAIDTIKDLLNVNIILLKNLKINKENMLKSIDSFSFATELADFLALKGVPFREAHHITGKIVSDCIESKKRLTDLKKEDLISYCEKFKDLDDNWHSIEKILQKREIKGGTGINSVKEQIKMAKSILKDLC
ncbi:MAG TPA: argininosuccinate lyase [Spirochaetota bacterium]|nr:argininosuccinate lyase [Spirochaetota bacterium]HOL57882.1 argininosuccinate lyase [Spirochaetota bacterium]HPP05408.1 argininosuccinate lyase [Spirochaetota bacterium]